MTSRVKSLVANGAQNISVDNNLTGNDPASGVVKRLRVEFAINGQQRTSEAQEGETLEVATNSKIIKAIYGALPLADAAALPTMDLTKKLSGLVEDGRLSVLTGNGLAGGDPVFGVPKELRVDFSLAGVRNSVTVAENEPLNIGQAAAPGEPPAFGLRAGADGNIFLQASAAAKSS